MADLPALLHDELKNFIDRVEEMLDEHKIELDEFVLIKFFFTKMESITAMKHIIKRVLPWKKYIERRDEDFFYKNKLIFGELPEDHVNYFSDLWRDTLDEDDKDEIWDFFETFVAFAETYNKKINA